MFLTREGDDRILTRVTDHVPAGFEFVGATLAIRGGDLSYQLIPVTPEVGAGVVTVVASGAGWSVPSTAGWLEFVVTYRVPQTAPYGAVYDTGTSFDLAGGDDSVNWNPSGLQVRITPDFGSVDFGSSLGGPAQQG
ncbi:hypothetical protein [Rhodococcus gannanensis]|uniref:Uncharacterized protein n=1 Tax=Rhodococcus gannanensis TaxID=1960308 RepID=A0ABW4P5A9_9NOCA